MSDTDTHRPVWVQCNDRRGDVSVFHVCRRSGGADCDLPPWPVDKHHRETGCDYHPVGELARQIYGDTYIRPRRSKPYRRNWFGSERTAQRAILRRLTRDAMHGGEVDEDVIDNRQTHRHSVYGGGWWD
jgi:hypothetical protein